MVKVWSNLTKTLDVYYFYLVGRTQLFVISLKLLIAFTTFFL